MARDSRLRRTHKIQVELNDYEMLALDNYCKKFKVSNRAKLVREALFTKVLGDFDDNYPTLFSKEEMKG